MKNYKNDTKQQSFQQKLFPTTKSQTTNKIVVPEYPG